MFFSDPHTLCDLYVSCSKVFRYELYISSNSCVFGYLVELSNKAYQDAVMAFGISAVNQRHFKGAFKNNFSHGLSSNVILLLPVL